MAYFYEGMDGGVQISVVWVKMKAISQLSVKFWAICGHLSVVS